MTASPPGRRRSHEYQDLMRHRIMDILLVSTPYDTYVLEEAGELSERMLGEFRNLDLHYAPGLTGISTGTEALRIARENSHVNLIITTPHLADMDAAELARAHPGRGSGRAGGAAGLGHARALRLPGAQGHLRDRADVPVAGRRAHAGEHRQVDRGLAERRRTTRARWACR